MMFGIKTILNWFLGFGTEREGQPSFRERNVGKVCYPVHCRGNVKPRGESQEGRYD